MRNDRESAGTATASAPPVPRSIPFDFGEDLDPLWASSSQEFAAMVNGASLVMPYLEPFLIRTMREVCRGIGGGDIEASARAFNTQEQHHYQAHRRFNELLKRKRYPELEQVEQAMEMSYARLQKRSLRVRMAYTAGFEAMTLGVTKWLIEKRVALFSGADRRVASFVLWHMVEETEHKRVAHDVYAAAFGRGLSAYLARVVGVFHGSFDVMRFSMRGYRVILKKEGLWFQWRSRLRLATRLAEFVRHVAPYLLRASLPGHDPRKETDPQWVKDWIAGYRRAEPGYLPLVDTTHPAIPVPFPPVAAIKGAAS